MLIEACLNGRRERSEHPALPLTPQELACEARRAVDAGAEALHMHPRNAQGAQSLAAIDIAEALQAVRASCPGTPVGVSTGLWIEETVERRLERIREWNVLPDFVGVNFYEPGAVELCALLQERGVGIEAGLRSVEDALLLLNAGLASGCLRLLLEPDEEEPEAALRTAHSMATHLNAAGVRRPLLLHGFEQTAWPLLEAACQRGYDTRIGFEDTLTLPDGSLAHSNVDLVAMAVERAKHSRHSKGASRSSRSIFLDPCDAPPYRNPP